MFGVLFICTFQMYWMHARFIWTRSSPRFLNVLLETSLSNNLVKASVLWPIMSYILYDSLSCITLLKPKDWLALYLLILVYLFGLPWLASCFCFTLINEHDVNIYDTILLFWLCWWSCDTLFRGLRPFSWVPLRKDMFMEWPPRITVQPWEWNGTPLAD
jgi:hypothetical protein